MRLEFYKVDADDEDEREWLHGEEIDINLAPTAKTPSRWQLQVFGRTGYTAKSWEEAEQIAKRAGPKICRKIKADGWVVLSGIVTRERILYERTGRWDWWENCQTV